MSGRAVGRWVVLAVAVLAVALALVELFRPRYMGPTKHNDAILQMQNIGKALQVYRAQTGAYPATLDSLVEPGAGPPLLDGGQSAITDPWGKRYNFEVVPDGRGGDRIVVWTTDDRGERLQWPRDR